MPGFDDALRSLDDRYVRLAVEKRIPAIAWGVVRDGSLVHALVVTPVADPSAVLADVAGRIPAGAGDGAPDWPEGLERADPVDAAAVGRALRAAAARYGEVRLGLPVAGDGRSATTWDLVTERGGRATLRVALDPDGGSVTEVVLVAPSRRPPHEAW